MGNRLLIAVYAVIAILALGATWSQNLAYFGGAPADAAFPLWTFVVETKANPASRSIMVDVLFLLLACVVFMVLEARRLGVRFVWLYVLFAFLVAISVTFPLFLIARQRRIAAGAVAVEGAPRATASDLLGLGVTAAVVLALAAFILSP